MSLFVPAGTAALAQTSALSVEEARTIVAPLLRGAQRTGEEGCREAPREGHQPGMAIVKRKRRMRLAREGHRALPGKRRCDPRSQVGDPRSPRERRPGHRAGRSFRRSGPAIPGRRPERQAFQDHVDRRSYDRKGKDRPLVPRRGLGRSDSSTSRFVAMAREEWPPHVRRGVSTMTDLSTRGPRPCR